LRGAREQASIGQVRTDLELIDAWGAGDASAGNELVQRHFDSIARFLQSKVDDPTIAADLIQRTFLGCLEARDRLSDVVSIRAYLLGIARRQLMDFLRKRHRDDRRADLMEVSLHEIGLTPTRAIAMREEQTLLLAALQRLPLKIQMALELHYWEQLPEREIATVLEIPPGTVKSRLFRGREMLRGHLRELAQSPELLESTLQGLERWARSLRKAIGTTASDPPA
jgi:RNA polymerase sigma factor (sigma-70 family)